MSSIVNHLRPAIYLVFIFITLGCNKQKPFPPDEEVDKSGYEYMADWESGYLDIHQISTGRGNCTFIILPDGTTMMVDAGDLGDGSNNTQEIMTPRPNAVKHPAEWIARYVKHFSAPLGNNGALDYLLITHFDRDHIGYVDRTAVIQDGKDYKLTGVTHLAQLVDIRTLIDRGYPSYDYPTRAKIESGNPLSFPNYYLYVKERDATGRKTEKFEVGSNKQIKLCHEPDKYPDFEVRNIAANGRIWTGDRSGVEEFVPPIREITEAQYPNENRCSCVFTMKYGKFDYYSGGDILGVAKNPEWFDVETRVAKVVGETDVVLANHHAYSDAMNQEFIAATKPQIYVIPVWDFYHPQPESLSRMLDTELYPDARMVFAAGLVESNRVRLGAIGQQIKPAGHVVVRVYEGGDEFQIFVLNDGSEDYEVIYKTDKIVSR